MLVSINVRGLDGVTKALQELEPKLRDRAVAMAINKTSDKAQVEIRRAITEGYNVPAADVRGAMVATKARGVASKVRGKIEIFGSPTRRGRSMNMVRFLASVQGMKTRRSSATKRQVAAMGQQLGFQVKRGGGLKQFRGAFIGNKGRTIFYRTGDKRLPIKPLQVIGMAQMFNSRAISARVLSKIDGDFRDELQRAIGYLLQKGKA